MLGHADRAEAEVELADVDRVQRGLERRDAGVQDVLGAHRVVLEVERADVHLRVHDVPDQLVRGVAAVGGEEDVAVGPLDVGAAAEHRDHSRDVAVADVVLAAVRAKSTFAVRGEDHVGRVDVGAVVTLGQAEGEDRPLVEQLGRARLRGCVGALPDRAEAEDRDLPGVPVGQAVEAKDLVEDRVARGVPALVGIAAAVTRWCQERRERALAREKLDEVGVPRVAERLGDEAHLALCLEPVDRGAQQSLRRGIELGGVVASGVQQARRGRGDGHPHSLSDGRGRGGVARTAKAQERFGFSATVADDGWPAPVAPRCRSRPRPGPVRPGRPRR